MGELGNRPPTDPPKPPDPPDPPKPPDPPDPPDRIRQDELSRKAEGTETDGTRQLKLVDGKVTTTPEIPKTLRAEESPQYGELPPTAKLDERALNTVENLRNEADAIPKTVKQQGGGDKELTAREAAHQRIDAVVLSKQMTTEQKGEYLADLQTKVRQTKAEDPTWEKAFAETNPQLEGLTARQILKRCEQPTESSVSGYHYTATGTGVELRRDPGNTEGQTKRLSDGTVGLDENGDWRIADSSVRIIDENIVRAELAGPKFAISKTDTPEPDQQENVSTLLNKRLQGLADIQESATTARRDLTPEQDDSLRQAYTNVRDAGEKLGTIRTEQALQGWLSEKYPDPENPDRVFVVEKVFDGLGRGPGYPDSIWKT